jgi:RNA polymerase sigma-70 factor (ECF subfamily)
MPLTRPSLLDRVRDPNRDDAWNEFVKVYAPLSYRHCHGRPWFLQEADAMDVTAKVFITLRRRMPDFAYDPNRGTFRAFLRKIVHRAIRDFRRSDARRKARVQKLGEQLQARGAERPEIIREHLAGLARIRRNAVPASAAGKSDQPEEERCWDIEFYRHVLEEALRLLHKEKRLNDVDVRIVQLWWTSSRKADPKEEWDEMAAAELAWTLSAVTQRWYKIRRWLKDKMLELAEDCPAFLMD